MIFKIIIRYFYPFRSTPFISLGYDLPLRIYNSSIVNPYPIFLLFFGTFLETLFVRSVSPVNHFSGTSSSFNLFKLFVVPVSSTTIRVK